MNMMINRMSQLQSVNGQPLRRLNDGEALTANRKVVLSPIFPKPIFCPREVTIHFVDVTGKAIAKPKKTIGIVGQRIKFQPEEITGYTAVCDQVGGIVVIEHEKNQFSVLYRKNATTENFKVHYQSYTWNGQIPETFRLYIPSGFNIPSEWQKVRGEANVYRIHAEDLAGVTANAGQHDLRLSAKGLQKIQRANSDLAFSSWLPEIGTLNIWPKLTIQFIEQPTNKMIKAVSTDDTHPAKSGRYYVDVPEGYQLAAGQPNYVDYEMTENQPKAIVKLTTLE
ncbi:hypothetical protein YK48G_21810 [Lentilactobacillus fungorum]|uniref:MucBP domain-containing protein n=1 Tax=Lentilactobacillus fungorum TaxID=2201250 RepID=A0ABQ3W3E9_9LACO|nr:MucBP domain-containing protein [Lentilactobacillus fungorum]GHP14756.1 hypothetical protein YK48G_21810 [Lentilactobacillus fungorum]